MTAVISHSQIAAHKEALILMKGYAKDGDTPAIKKLAAKIAPTVQMHLSMAEKQIQERHEEIGTRPIRQLEQVGRACPSFSVLGAAELFPVSTSHRSFLAISGSL